MNPIQVPASGAAAPLAWFSRSAVAIEVLAVAMILGCVAVASVIWLYHLVFVRGNRLLQYERYRHRLARSLLVGLEVLVAADIVRTVALEQSLAALLELALLVVIRTFLSWSIVVELEGRWPWQPRGQEGVESAGRGDSMG